MESIEDIKLRLISKDPEQRIDALLDAWEYGTAGIELVIAALEDPVRKVRQSALLLLSESETEIAKQALWNYLPFRQMQCLHTITEFKFDSFNTEYHPDYFAIADYNNTLVCYWDINYKISGVAIWNFETGNRKIDFSLTAHEFELGKHGKVFINSFQDVILSARDIETQKIIDKCSIHPFMRGTETSQAFSVCTTDLPLVAAGECRQTTNLESGQSIRATIGHFKIWNYETYSCLLHSEFENLILCSTNDSVNFLIDSKKV